MEAYIEDKKYLYASILEFLEESEEVDDDEFSEKSFEKLNKVIESQHIESDAEEMRQFLEIIKSIGENHHRCQQFNERMNQLLFHYKDQIKQTLSNSEIFRIFENNKKIVLFLIKKDIITISEEISEYILGKIENNGKRYCHFFIPELEKILSSEKMEIIKKELLKENPNIFTNYEEKREEGENDSHICTLIRHDSVEDFISHINSYNISPMSKISPSIFETNPFLIDKKNTTLIEYSTFFGSIKIFQYLLNNNAILTPPLWFYAIHSNNAELFYLLESNKVSPPKSNRNKKEEKSTKNYELCLIESIKCHHNDITKYIESNYINQTEKDSEEDEEIISNCIKYHNYLHFQNDAIIDYGFFYLRFYHYDKLFELLLKFKEKLNENKEIQYQDIQRESKNNQVEIIYHDLLRMQEIDIGFFRYKKIKQIVIPSTITSINEYAFEKNSTLTQIVIPSSVTSIGNNVFFKCSSLTQITFDIPSSLTSIGNYAFFRCFSLTKIAIPSSVTSIRDSTFKGCSRLTQITIPSSVKSIEDSAFFGCSSLTQITIPSSVKSIGKSAFKECSSLTQIIIPSSVTSIEDSTFYGCSKLTQITIPSSITSVGNHAFYGCSSLAQITIPSSAKSIGKSAFKGCSSLTQIVVPSFVTSIEDSTFYGCSKLTQITIPSSIISIGDYAFYGCSSLAQITIPSSVTSIGSSTFYGCSSLTQVKIPSSVNSIGKSAFFGCSSLIQIAIPSSISPKYLEINPRTMITLFR